MGSRPGTPFPPPPMRLPRRAYRTLPAETLAPPPRVSLIQESAPPLLEIQTVLNVDETASVQQSEPAMTAADREGVEPLSSSPVIPVPRRTVAETVPAAAGIHSPMASTGIFIGNVPLHTHGSDFSSDKFAASFDNSTRKTLSYVHPSIQHDEIVVRPSIDVVREGSRRWDNMAVGYFLGRKPYYHHLNDYVRPVWPAVKTVTATSNGFYFFQFKTEIAMEEIIEGGPWLFQGQPIVLHSTVASGVGRPLYQDTITRACTRLDFARVCVMLDISSTLPKHLTIMMPTEDDNEVPCKVEVEYEWVPPKCKTCMSLGHTTAACPESKKTVKPPVAVYVQKRTLQQRSSSPLRRTILTVLYNRRRTGRMEMLSRSIELQLTRLMIRGKRHLECSRFQPSRPSDGGEGVSIRIQFIHCRITIRCAHLSVLATVVYGTNDTISRRGLWQKLVTLANSISDEPWIVGGDFNTVLDMSEVCGSSADIQLAMTEFRDCILDTGLIHLLVQGERFSWHICSEGDRSLWKRLDRLIVNAAWLGQWPNSRYNCLNARTSDHSPLVIRGDTATHTVSMFRFDNYLTMSSDFTPSVQNVWRHRIEGTSMYAVTRKLRALKPVFRSLRKKKGDLSLNVKLAAEFLGKVQQLL
ncbi:hypothetical protein Sango_3103100 [Sesamum angolense]|uniref:DUF4283 domain-containing protein n=1 Tax=Sesamum angolense TaxID=2727404 RepID=A0AAE1T977_9LAMI|nr:hypothetical protein Sango_3103100 [Sesamum angolense]